MNIINKLEGLSLKFYNKPKKLIFLLHGYGDNAENFIQLARYFNKNIVEANFFAPNAPFIVPEYTLGRQWFNPYPKGIHYNKAGPKEKATMQQECDFSIKQLDKYIRNLCLEYNLLHQDCFIIGFSQGAMITYELGNFIKKKLAGCAVLSGRILSPQKLRSTFFVKTPLLIVHGDRDEVVDPGYYTEACRITKSRGFSIEAHLIKDEGHTISPKTQQLVQNFIKKFV